MRRSTVHPRALVLILLLALAPAASAQQRGDASPAAAPAAERSANGKVLTLEDYGPWKRLQAQTLSPDGAWLAWVQSPNEGDDSLFVKALDGERVHAVGMGRGPAFSPDSRWVSFTVSPPEKEQEKLRKAKKPIVRTLRLLELATGTAHDLDDVASSEFTSDGRFFAARRAKADRDAEHDGTDLVLRDLRTGVVQVIGNVSELVFDSAGTRLAYTVDAPEAAGNGLFLLHLADNRTVPLHTGADRYAAVSWSDDATDLAVLRGTTPDSLALRANALEVVLEAGARGQRRVTYEPSSDAGVDVGLVLSEDASPEWSNDGRRLFVGLKLQKPAPPEGDEPRANVDVWHWKDERVQSVQQVRAQQDRRYTYAAVFNLEGERLVRLADDDMRTATPTQDGRWVLGRLDAPYRMDISWGGSRADYYRLDPATGERTLLVEGLGRPMGTSPDGRWFLFMRDGQLKVQSLENGQVTDLSALAGVSFEDHRDDHPYELPAYGLAGWSKDGRSVLVYTDFDLWSLPLGSGGRAVNLTKGVGEREQIRFRVERLDREPRRGGFGFGGGGSDDPGIDTSEPLLLSAYGEWTKKSGWYELRPGGEPRPLVYEDAMLGSVQKAKDADRVAFTRQTFEQFPDVWVSGTDFRSPRKVTDANPQLAEYAWGRRVLVDYENSRGQKLQGTLALPAGYEPGSRYPMIVYFYELMSQRHHQFSLPVYDDRPHMSTYASDGYLVLMPDVVYEIGRPGSSALDNVLSAVDAVIEAGYADPARIGLQGHSWGGYQSSFIVTQTDRFAAVVTGAPPTNLVSFHGELYKRTGTVQQGITERGQVRMGTNPWDGHELYESQSPVHQVRNITTPFLILHGTEDGAVDWSQGLEYYNAARRWGKNVILLSYPGEPHHLEKRENQKDFQVRMKQYFDHYLKGAPAPLWMTDGVPFLDKEVAAPTDMPAGSTGN
ncbi:MAG TPA: prolyl oligopeptidase family serine peptidase [Longimicrobiales bacterium]|nr:prolyl oligopeptidase family serine peptidase [Longimicrobiales bacterium]